MEAKFFVDINLVEKNLKDLGLLQRRNSAVSHKFDFARIRGDTYKDYWMSYYRENWYDFQLTDLSLLFFNENSRGGKTFLFLGCPILCKDEEAYYRSYEETNDNYRSTYDDYLATCPRVENVAYLRYDFAPNQYVEGCHPAFHIHFGYNQANRVGIKYDLSITAFVSIVLRQYYPDYWNRVLNEPELFSGLFGHKAGLRELEASLFNSHDIERDYYLS